MSTEPTPYYETPPSAPSRVRLYLGDCRELLPLVAPPSKQVLMLADVPYGVGHSKAINRAVKERAPRKTSFVPSGKNRVWPTITGDDLPFDPSHLLAYPRLLIWGWNHFADRLPPTSSVIVWDKRVDSGSDDGSDVEIAWTNLGGPARCFRHLWRGTCRASETGVKHLHPTQKPEAFYRWLLGGRGRGKTIFAKGDLVVSPYLGSGPEIAPCMELGLDFIGIDTEKEYLDIAIEKRMGAKVAR